MSLVVNTSRPLYMHFSYVTVRNEFYESCSYYFFMYKDGKRFSDLQKRGKRERGKKGGRKQVAVPLLRKWALVSVKSQESKALSKDSSGQVRAVPPAGVTTLEGGTGWGGSAAYVVFWEVSWVLSTSGNQATSGVLLRFFTFLLHDSYQNFQVGIRPTRCYEDYRVFPFLLKKEFGNIWYLMLYRTSCRVTTTMLCSQGAKWEAKLNM